MNRSHIKGKSFKFTNWSILCLLECLFEHTGKKAPKTLTFLTKLRRIQLIYGFNPATRHRDSDLSVSIIIPFIKVRQSCDRLIFTMVVSFWDGAVTGRHKGIYNTINGTDHHILWSCCDVISPARRTITTTLARFRCHLIVLVIA